MQTSALRVIGTFDKPTADRYHWELWKPDPDITGGRMLLRSARAFRDRTSAIADFAIARAYMMEADIRMPDVGIAVDHE